jgi:hypothetical protein
MSLFPEGNGLNKNHDPGIWSTTPEFGSKRTPHLRSTVPNVQRHMAYFAREKGRGLMRKGNFQRVIGLSAEFSTRGFGFNAKRCGNLSVYCTL